MKPNVAVFIPIAALYAAIALAQTAGPADVAMNWNTIILSAFGLIGTCFAGYMTLQQNKIHKAVNSNLTAAVNEDQRKQALINTLSAHASNLEQQLAPPSTAPLAPSPPPKSVAAILSEFEATRPPNPNAIKS